MHHVNQTVFGYPNGNCFPACLASIFEIPLDEIPHFGDEDWFERFNDWLRPRGWYACCIPKCEWIPEGIYILSGTSPRAVKEGKNYLHAVVAQDGEIIHDPHPDKDGLVDIVDYTLLLPLDPGKVIVKVGSYGTLN